jgi:hypothetical protein
MAHGATLHHDDHPVPRSGFAALIEPAGVGRTVRGGLVGVLSPGRCYGESRVKEGTMVLVPDTLLRTPQSKPAAALEAFGEEVF